MELGSHSELDDLSPLVLTADPSDSVQILCPAQLFKEQVAEYNTIQYNGTVLIFKKEIQLSDFDK